MKKIKVVVYSAGESRGSSEAVDLYKVPEESTVSAKQQKAVVTLFQQGMDINDIAEVLNIEMRVIEQITKKEK